MTDQGNNIEAKGRATLLAALKSLKQICDREEVNKCRIHFYRIQDQIENTLYDENEESYKKWKQEFSKYLKLKAKSWQLKGESKPEIIVCRICEKKFKENVFKEHSAECFELSEWKNDLKKKISEISKACETAFEKKQELDVNARLEK